MALICIGSIAGAPGVTTLSVLSAASWPRPVVLIEADPSGGVLAVRYRLARSPGLAGLASVVRQGAPPEAVWAYSQMLPGDLPVVVAPESGPVTAGILDDAAHPLARWCRDHAGVDVIVDCGRLAVRDVTWPLWAAADDLLLVTRPRADELYPVAHRFKTLDQHVGAMGLVLVGDRPYRPEEVALQLGLPIRGVISDDARAASVLARGGSGRTLRRSALVRSVRSLVDSLALRLGVPVVVPEAALPAPGNGARRGGAAAPNRSEDRRYEDRRSEVRRSKEQRWRRRQREPERAPRALPPPPPPAPTPSPTSSVPTPTPTSPPPPPPPPAPAAPAVRGQGDLDSAIAAAEKLGSRAGDQRQIPPPPPLSEGDSFPPPAPPPPPPGDLPAVPVPAGPDEVVDMLERTAAVLSDGAHSDGAGVSDGEPSHTQPAAGGNGEGQRRDVNGAGAGEAVATDDRPVLPRRSQSAYPGPDADPHSKPMPAAPAAAVGGAASPGPGAAAPVPNPGDADDG